METIEQLRSKIDTAEGLQSVVSTMKGLAAVNIRQYERAVDSLEQYYRTIELGLHAVLKTSRGRIGLRSSGAASADGAVLAIVVGSDQGMVGQFNARILDHAMEHAGQMTAEPMFLTLGKRLTAALQSEGKTPLAELSLPSSASGILPAVQELLLAVERTRVERNAGRVMLFNNRPLSGASYEPGGRSMLPLDLEWLSELEHHRWPTSRVPMVFGDEQQELSSLVRHLLFIELFGGLAESLAAENASRLSAMQAAEKNIGQRLDGLRMRYHRRRQNAITEELLDVVAGFETLRD